MPRNSSDTRQRLLAAAERLFASKGIWQVPVRDIIDEAGQRNTSAVSYHFGSREGVLEEILRTHGEGIDVRRGELLVGLDERAGTATLVGLLVRVLTERMDDESSRRYIQIVAQLSNRYAEWRTGDSPNLERALEWIEARPAGLSAEVRAERTVGMIMLMTTSLANRARELSSNRGGPTLGPVEYEANLVDMLVGVIEAPISATI